MIAVDERRQAAAETIVFILLASATMLFAAFTASYLIRRTGSDWSSVRLPGAAWAAAAVLVASSWTLSRSWHGATLGLSFLFAAGQVLAWRQLADQGVFVPSSPHAAFFYMLSCVHGVHMIAGMVGIGAAMAGRVRTRLVAAWWHFVGGLWLYTLFLLQVL